MLKENGPDFSILIPIEPWLRQQLNTAETFVQQHLKNQPTGPIENLIYKPLWAGDMMYVRMANWCQIFKQNRETGQYSSTDLHSLGRGNYNITIELPYIYIGPHKNGETVSLTTRIVQITFEPENVQKVAQPAPVTIPIKTSVAKGRRRKHVAKNQEDQEGTSTQGF